MWSVCEGERQSGRICTNFFVYFRRAVFALGLLVMRELGGVDIVPIGDVFIRD